MIIEDLIKFDKENLNDWKLIYHHHRKLRLILNFSCAFISACMIAIPIMFDCQILYLLYLPAIFFGWISIKYARKETMRVLLNRYNKEYELNITDSWSSRTIKELQFKLLSDFIKKMEVSVVEEDIIFIIDSLKFEAQRNSYNLYSTGITMSLVSGLIGAFVGSTFSIAKSLPEIIDIFKPFFAILFSISVVLIYSELWIVKPMILRKRNRYIRLIKALQEFYLKN